MVLEPLIKDFPEQFKNKRNIEKKIGTFSGKILLFCLNFATV